MWAFCLNSVFRQYGWLFFGRMAFPHPLRTARAILRSGALDVSGDMTEVCPDGRGGSIKGVKSIVGVGFCLKPTEPECPSGRANHDCQYLENLPSLGASGMPAPCRQCTIREIGVMALEAGAAFYIMTSARDVLVDVFAPALEKGRFSSGLFVLCRYSLQPFAVGLTASGMYGRLLPLEKGDCRDYRTWLQADRGIKDERTSISKSVQGTIAALLCEGTYERRGNARFERRGNVLYGRT